MNHRKTELRSLIRKLRKETDLSMDAIGKHPAVVKLAGRAMCRQHVNYYIKIALSGE